MPIQEKNNFKIGDLVRYIIPINAKEFGLGIIININPNGYVKAIFPNTKKQNKVHTNAMEHWLEKVSK